MPKTKEVPAAAGANLPATVAEPTAVAEPEITHTRTALVLPEGLAFERWEEIGGTLQTMREGLNWWVGDWINYGEQAYGETYAQAVEETGRSEQTLMNVSWVARQFPIERRRESLSWSHHAEVAALDPAEADRLLDRAEAENLSKSSLRDLVREAKKKIPAAKPAAPEPTHKPTGDDLPPAGDPVDEPEDEAPSEGDLVAELEAAHAEITRLEALVESLRVDDKAEAIVAWSRKYAQLEGRLRQCMAEAAEAKKQATYFGKILRGVREMLGVESNGKIVNALLARIQ